MMRNDVVNSRLEEIEEREPDFGSFAIILL